MHHLLYRICVCHRARPLQDPVRNELKDADAGRGPTTVTITSDEEVAELWDAYLR